MRAARRSLGLSLIVLLAACSADDSNHTADLLTGPVMGTYYRITVVDAPDGVERSGLEQGAIAVMDRVDRYMSTYKSDSELSRFNRSDRTDWVPVSADLVTVLDEAIQVSEISAGAFDVTVGPLVNLWGFGPENRRDQVPAEADIAAAKARVGFKNLEVRMSPPAIRKALAGVYVDLSAIAKGYAVDQVCAFLESRGVHNYLVDIGGDLRAKGINERGTPWNIAIERPVPGERAVQQIVQLSDAALATSGDYRNYFEQGGKRYSHTIDPRTGRPVVHRLASVSVAASTAMYADAMATAINVLGPDAGFDLAERQKLAVFLLVKTDNGFSARHTREFAALLTSRQPPGGG